ncbi:nitroreductase family deazaflavin-dependent oxidoreductase [Yimella sp. NH-Cas1]|uniref:nitroreductase family deazaflavin-dependent oxidoreductase n=1 Tax=Yimella sp. NH-Cas1 TaxID=2917726 RepID=UPI001EFA3390|nr:nitroreductase family deazaflavin-dependent oxidoreductase [Yimella sp. NH-Cas1]MCG8655473.1 nitroreductase family deazaflavin-dependent oxidoreductase [Yimella sp. NH-Cas1]
MPLQGEYALEKTPWVAQQLAAIDEAGTTEVADVQGMPVVVYTIRGNKSGLLRRVPLMRVEKDGVYAAVASKGGAPEHPAWYHNIVANPDVEVQDGSRHLDGVARRISGAERDEWWERAVAAFPPYAEYQTKTDREIPVFLIEAS